MNKSLPLWKNSESMVDMATYLRFHFEDVIYMGAIDVFFVGLVHEVLQ
jgi:hypothetical protein